MDVGEYDTNVLIINNISLVSFRIYEPVVSQSSPYTFAASDVESTLRNAGHLVYADSLRRGIWCFHLVGKDGSPIGTATPNGLGATLEVCGYKLGRVEEGGFDPIFLLKGRHTGGATSINTPSGTSPSGSAIDMTLRSAQSFAVTPSQPLSGLSDAETKGSSVAESKGYTSIPVKDVYEYFISAVLASLSSVFCSRTGAIALNYKSVLLPGDGQQTGDKLPVQRFTNATLATFRVYLTTTGSLLISLCHSLVKGLASSAETLSSGFQSVGTPLLAAPLGVYATYQGILDAEHPSAGPSAVQSPDTQIGRLRPERDDRLALWRAHCAKMLEMRGISPTILQGSVWLSVQYQSRRPGEQRADGKHATPSSTTSHVLWPSALCFWKLGGAPGFNHRSKAPLPTIGGSDPLSSAKSWFQEGDEREGVLTKRIKDREAATTRDVAEIDARNSQPDGYSPLALRHTGNNGLPGSAVAGTMYPTPPDVVQATVGVTPSFDGAVSSPANQGNTTAMVDVDAAMTNASNNGDPFGESWDGGDVKREAENLFDDMGDDYFTNNDITDADFNFFDEQPDGPDLEFPGVADIATAPATASNIERDAMQSQTSMMLSGSSAAQEKAPPVFAKPELKHARSSLGDDSRQMAGERKPSKPLPSHGIKRPASPFNDVTVYKRVKASLGSPAVSVSSVTKRSPKRRTSIFERVDFSPLLSLNSKKYAENGRFNCDWDTSQENLVTERSASLAREPSRRQGRGIQDGLHNLPDNMGALLASITGGLETSSLLGEAVRSDDSPSDADDISQTSDEDGSSGSADEALSPTKSAVTRKRLDDDSVSLAASTRETEGAIVPSQVSPDLLRFPSSDISETSVARFFTDPEPPPPQFVLTDDDFMTVAQIVTEQAVSGSLKLPTQVREARCMDHGGDNRRLAEQARRSVETLRSVLPATLSGATGYQFRPLLEVQDLPLLGQPTRMQPRAPGGTEPIKLNVFPIPAPHFELRRNDAKLSMAASAVTFWEVLGLGPCRGQKDINAVCVYANHEGMADDVNVFLDRTKILYEALKLGTHDRLGPAEGISDGLVPLDLDKTVTTPLSSVLSRTAFPGAEQIGRLAQALAAQSVREKNFVVYFIYSPESPTAVMDACVSFHRLFELYSKTLSAKSPVPNELVLQLVSVDFVTSASTLVLPQSSRYTSLCLEMYDRCTLFGGPMPSPAILLEQPLPRVIDFKFTTTPSENLFHENSCIHIAYAQSIDQRWVTAAWTDNRGSKQMTASYCLGRKGKPLATPVTDVAREIWDTTHDLISVWKVHWRVVVTKCGTMDQDEIDLWLDLAKTESRASVTLTLLTVDTGPSLQLIPPPLKVPATAPNMFYTTPVSTPQASIVSPEQSGNNPPTPLGAGSSANATTPGGDNAATEPDADATLIDVTETSWGTVASHRLNNATVLGDLNPALASGYLVKRTGPRPEDPPALMEVNVIHTGANARAYEPLLREMLMYFRQLGTLARARGMVERETDVRPWHVAAAEKGVKALYMLM